MAADAATCSVAAMLASFGLCERLVKGDGNCQARPPPAHEAPAACFLRG